MRTSSFDLLKDQELIELYYLVLKLDIDKEFQMLIYGELKARGFIRSKYKNTQLPSSRRMQFNSNTLKST